VCFSNFYWQNLYTNDDCQIYMQLQTSLKSIRHMSHLQPCWKRINQQISHWTSSVSMITAYIVRHHDCEQRLVVRVECNVQCVRLKQHQDTVHNCSSMRQENQQNNVGCTFTTNWDDQYLRQYISVYMIIIQTYNHCNWPPRICSPAQKLIMLVDTKYMQNEVFA